MKGPRVADTDDVELKDHYRKVAERVVADRPDKREKLNEGAKQVIETLRESVPDASEETLIMFLRHLSMMTAAFSVLRIDSLVAALDNTFNSTTLAAANLLGVYDLDDTESPVKTVEELTAEYEHEMRKAAEDLGPFPGNYL